ncbi:hypothetical protein LTR53_008578 [Teratosphaeriaceae sp. CCFEE 6253]|nr:hypothetical protein LTR53_008578 [Teratosphaeriaceae sp. CCFEE 6253]
MRRRMNSVKRPSASLNHLLKLMEDNDTGPPWLRRYASSEYEWRTTSVGGQTRLYRPIGLVESCFDSDGRYWGGRADINLSMETEISTSLDGAALRERILLAWTCLRCQHWLLQAKALRAEITMAGARDHGDDIFFAIDLPSSPDDAIDASTEHLVHLADHFDSVDPEAFWLHCQNAARIPDPTKALARMFVFPVEQRANSKGTSTLRFLTVGAHHIWDGLATYVWMRDFVHLLNKTPQQLRERLHSLLDPESLTARLPLPQEALYPPISGSRARQRWIWLLARILRHVRRPLQAGFANPLQRRIPLTAVPLSPTYAAVLDYSRIPVLNSAQCPLAVQIRGTRRLHRLCREAKASIGAGCFALAALVMMEMYEALSPQIPLAERKPFISGFPLNPRAFFNHHVDPDSCMLAFSDGIALPFLSSTLPFDGRLRLLARQAHRQLAAYQKRTRPARAEDEKQYMSSRGAGRVLTNQYIGSIERANMLLPEHLRDSVNPQGAYPARSNLSTQTCGVSSVGRRDAVIKAGMYDVHDESRLAEQGGLVVDYRSINAGVRAREGEFLIGIGGSDDGLWVNVSIDASSIDMELVKVWKERMESILDENVDETARL